MFGNYNGQQPYQPQFGNPYMERLNAMTQPQMYQPQQMAQPGLIRVTGIEGAKAYQMGPNSAVPLFDANNDIFFVKSTDGAGFPTIRAFRFSPIEATPAPQNGEYVTRQEFEELKGMILNGQQLIREQPQQPAADQPVGNASAVPAIPAAVYSAGSAGENK